MNLTKEQSEALNKSIAELGMLSGGIREQMGAFDDTVNEVKSGTTSVKQLKSTLIETNSVMGSIASELDNLYRVQKILFEALTGKKIKSPEKPAAQVPAPVAIPDEDPGFMSDFLDGVLGFLKGPLITPLIVSGITYILGEYVLSDETKQNIKNFFAGLLGTDFETLENAWDTFTTVLEGATAALAAFFAWKLSSGIFGLFGRRLPFGNRGAFLAALAAAGLTLADDLVETLFPDEDDEIGPGTTTPEEAPAASTEIEPIESSSARQAIFDEIARGEGSYLTPARMGAGYTEYDTVYGYGQYLMPPGPVSTLTFNELYQYQRDLIAATRGQIPGTSSGTSAVGKYQMVATSMYGRGRGPNNPAPNSWFARSGLSPTDKFSPENQELLMEQIAADMGMDRKLAAGDYEGLQNSLAQQFASQQTASGADIYGQGAHVTSRRMVPLFEAARNAAETGVASAPVQSPIDDPGALATTGGGGGDLSPTVDALTGAQTFEELSRVDPSLLPQSIEDMLRGPAGQDVQVASAQIVHSQNNLNQQVVQLRGGSTISPLAFS